MKIIDCQHWSKNESCANQHGGCCSIGLYGEKPSYGTCLQCVHSKTSAATKDQILGHVIGGAPINPKGLPGPGDVATAVIKQIYQHESASTCGCDAIRKKMNDMGWVWCLRHRKELVAEIIESAKKKGVLIDAQSFWQAHREMRRDMRKLNKE